MNTDPRDHLFFPDALFLAGGGWPGSNWNGGRHQIGRLAAIRLEYLAALRWNSHADDPPEFARWLAALRDPHLPNDEHGDIMAALRDILKPE